ncbi:hypothetical protein KY290_024707 [Solanum tuberosum]|uniref:Reverse transcriptase Ty1/copia-type domain-containing protein n=1 Tax=Solanum tuberosum TaxID=4113 RepID=A0ABQ7URG1_SOLTU|nr:hypothetical protein KY284_023560 [Solanum tuberosum]KAH0754437.1 hypothetical protein KY290_024707 [Solanum tuberosum]
MRVPWAQAIHFLLFLLPLLLCSNVNPLSLHIIHPSDSSPIVVDSKHHLCHNLPLILLHNQRICPKLLRPHLLLHRLLLQPSQQPDHNIIFSAPSNYLVQLPDHVTPYTFKQALKHPVWRLAMKDGFDALIRNQTWELVPQDSNKNVVDCKWIYRIKKKVDCSVDRYKVRLVAKGFTQRPGLDYHCTSSPVVKPTTIHSHSDPSLFVCHSSNGVVYLWVYVDDIILTGNNSSVVHQVISSLASHISLKDLGPSSSRWQRSSALTSKVCFRPSPRSSDARLQWCFHSYEFFSKFLQNNGTPSHDATEYRKVIGKLQYLSFSRSDVSYSMNKLFQFMHAPSEAHWKAVKRLLRYLKSTATYGLRISLSTSLNLSPYSS